MKTCRYNGIELINLTDLFTEHSIYRARGGYTPEGANEYFWNKQVRNLKNEYLTNRQAVINLAFTIFPRLKINDLITE